MQMVVERGKVRSVKETRPYSSVAQNPLSTTNLQNWSPNTRAGGAAIYQNSSEALNIITPSIECSVSQSDIYGTIQSSVVDLCLDDSG
ncbi:hypothetical protein TNCV_3143991 [Trichonephila clavipes]|nr:hypothetical protein TNCV_3143991 [Trichonephila clavipes]